MPERKTIVVSYITEKTGTDAIREDLDIRNSIGAVCAAHTRKFIVAPEELVNETVIKAAGALLKSAPPARERS